MNKYKKLSIFSTILAVIMSDIMSAHLAIIYCNRLKYGDSSTATNVAILIAIGYIMMIFAALVNSYILWNKSEKK